MQCLIKHAIGIFIEIIIINNNNFVKCEKKKTEAKHEQICCKMNDQITFLYLFVEFGCFAYISDVIPKFLANVIKSVVSIQNEYISQIPAAHSGKHQWTYRDKMKRVEMFAFSTTMKNRIQTPTQQIIQKVFIFM